MATKEEVAEMMAVMSLVYPNFTLSKEIVTVYHDLLQDIPADALEAAGRQVITGTDFFPSLAQWRNKALELMAGKQNLPLPVEAYTEAVTFQPVRKHLEETAEGFVITHETCEWSNKLVEQAAIQMGWPSRFPTDNPMADRAQFFKVYDSLINRAVEDMKLLPGSREITDKYAGLKQLTSTLVKQLEDGK